MSKSNLFPDGLANSSGMVGKCLMWDQYLPVNGLFEHPLNEYKSIRATRVIHDYYRADPKRGFYGGGGIDARSPLYPIAFALGSMPPGSPSWGREYKRFNGEAFVRTMTLAGHTTSLPVPSNTVTLHSQVKDAWGLPVVQITYSPHADDVKTLRWIREKQVELLEAAGARQTWGPPVERIGTSTHLMGTCRMGNDPTRSVVNPFSRSHDVKNLFIVDGSNFVTSARQMPTATIQALAYRASEHMVLAAKSGDL
jgi:choline dehydrogenase-like flavoprotein